MENEIKKSLENLLTSEKPIVFEIGSHECEDTEYFFNINKNSSVFCFEPDPRNIKTIKSKEIYKKIFLFEGAVSESEKETILYQSHGKAPDPTYWGIDWNYSSSIKKPTGVGNILPWMNFTEEIKVKCTTIDSFCHSQCIQEIDFIWCDSQGSEEDIIKGAKNMLPNIKSILLEDHGVEHYENYKSTESIIKEHMSEDWFIAKKFTNDRLLINRRFYPYHT